MSSLSTLPNGDSAWLLRKAIERIMQQVSVLETNIGSSTTGNSANTQIIFNDNGTLRGDAGLTYNATTDTLTVGNATITGNLTVDTNTFFVDSANNRVGFGTLTPARPVDIVGSFQSSAGWALVGSPAGLGGTTRYIGGAGGTDSWYFNALTGGNHLWAFGEVEAMRLNANGLGLGVVPAAGRGALQLSSGINFPATQVASSDPNTLDDYEEGTWTGTLIGATTNPTTPVTATGRYTKIGRQVSIQIHFSNVDTTGASGQIKVTGSPFSSNSSVGSTGAIMMSSIGSFTGSPTAFIGTGTTEIEIYASSSAGAIGFVNHNAGASRSLWINLTYTV